MTKDGQIEQEFLTKKKNNKAIVDISKNTTIIQNTESNNTTLHATPVLKSNAEETGRTFFKCIIIGTRKLYKLSLTQ